MTLTKLIELQEKATQGGYEECRAAPDFLCAARNFDFAALDAKMRQMEQDIGKLVIQRESLKEALRFYADAENYTDRCTDSSHVQNDNGHRAQQALNQGE